MRKALLASCLVAIAACGGGDGGSTGPAAVASVTISPRDQAVTEGSAPIAFSAVVKDADGNVLTDRTVDWVSTNAGSATLSPATGASTTATLAAVGTSYLVATSESKKDSVLVTISAAGAAPAITDVSGSVLSPSQANVTITGTNFSPTVASDAVLFDGVLGTVTAATATSLSVTLPAASSFSCTPTHQANVVVKVGAQSSAAFPKPLQVATPRDLNIGEALVLSTAQEAHCNELANHGGKYFVTVVNVEDANQSSLSPVSHPFQLRGAAATYPVAQVAHASVSAPRASERPTAVGFGGPRFNVMDLAVASQAEAMHEHRLESDRRLLSRIPVPHASRSGVSASVVYGGGAVHAAVSPTIGAYSQVRIRKADDTQCTQYDQTTVRTVYSGSKVIIAVDTSYTPPGGTHALDTYYTELGTEFENVMLPILSNNFGDPLAADSLTDNDGHFNMIFSPIINGQGPNLLGFVNPCDNFPQSQLPVSNLGQYFYAFVPITGDGRGATANEWRAQIRPVLIHESKHIVSDAGRYAHCVFDAACRVVPGEDVWLEEGTAVLSQELYLRTFSPAMTWRGHADFEQAILCDIPGAYGAVPACTNADHPVVLTTTGLGFLYDYLSKNETKTFLGRVAAGDGQWYGGGWMFARWAVDQFGGGSESAFLKTLVQEPTTAGLTNLSAKTGHSAEEMLTEFATAFALESDSLVNVSASNPRLTIPSWNLQSVFYGMNHNTNHGSTGIWSKEYPLADHAATYGSFTTSVGTFYSGDGSVFILSGTQSAAQLLALESPGGGAPNSKLRMSIVRVQ